MSTNPREVLPLSLRDTLEDVVHVLEIVEAIPDRKTVKITDDCTECNFCIERFECPAIYHDQELGRTNIDPQICSGCGVCLSICPKGAIVEAA